MKQRRPPIIAIDGPSGAGKSTLSRRLAERLGYTHIDTGAMYRCVALAAHRSGVDLADAERLGALARALDIRLEGAGERQRVVLDGEDVTRAIRTPENSLRTSRVAAVAEVRRALVELQRNLGREGGVVLEGRDIGSVVFPAAEVKIYLEASAEERGRRRFLELQSRGEAVDLAQTILEVRERDAADRQREHSPLVRAEDAVVLDSSGLTIEEVLAEMLRIVAARCQETGP